MIKSLTAQNVLSWKDLHMEFSPGVNMLVGDSGKGKSAIMACLWWPLNNDPLGDDHLRWGSKNMFSEIEFIEGTRVKLERRTTNKYHLTLPGGDTQILGAVGRQVPEQVKQVINMNMRINFQRQLEKTRPIFLLTEGPGEVAKFFNNVSGLYLIDDVQRLGNQKVTASGRKIKELNSQIKEKKEELEGYAVFEEAAPLLERAKKLKQQIVRKKETIDKICVLLSNLEERDETLAALRRKARISDKVKKGLQLVAQMEEKRRKEKEICRILKELKETEKALQLKPFVVEMKPLLGRGISIMKAAEHNHSQYVPLHNLLLQIKGADALIAKSKKRLKKKKAEYKKAFPDICPLCGSEVHHHD